MAKAYLLSESDRNALREALDKGRRQQHTTVQRGPDGRIDHEEQQAPEVHIARAPPEGIPGLLCVEPPIPGSADCYCWHIVYTGTVPELVEVSSLFKLVHNLSGDEIPGDAWIIIGRDKFGSWLVLEVLGSCGSSSSSESSEESSSSESESSEGSEESGSSDSGSEESRSGDGSGDGSGGSADCPWIRVVDYAELDMVNCTLTNYFKWIRWDGTCVVEIGEDPNA